MDRGLFQEHLNARVPSQRTRAELGLDSSALSNAIFFQFSFLIGL